MKKYNVLGNLKWVFAGVFGGLSVVFPAVFLPLYLHFRAVGLLVNLLCWEPVCLVLTVVIPLAACRGRVFLEIDSDGARLVRGKNCLFSLCWEKAEVSLAALATKGTAKSPAAFVGAIAIAPRGKMPDPPRFSSGATVGKGGVACVSFDGGLLRALSRVFPGTIGGDLDPAACGLSRKACDKMQEQLEQLQEE